AGPAATSEPGPDAPSAADVRAARKEVARIDRRLARIAAREGELHEQMAAAATDHETVQRLDAELRELAAEREALEEEWFLAAETAG
ncbi:ABC transporter ATP-binding protein, partial [Actinotalea ferrariae]|nr:ABC transporter ATP-binding protein [Actinotalea ferrariae]